jgi:hypothetical protein
MNDVNDDDNLLTSSFGIVVDPNQDFFYSKGCRSKSRFCCVHRSMQGRAWGGGGWSLHRMDMSYVMSQ